MGDTPSVEYRLGANVEARYDGNETTYYSAKIIKKHEYGKYDVKFAATGKILTVFWDDIKAITTEPIIESPPNPSISPPNNNHKSTNYTIHPYSEMQKNKKLHQSIDTETDEKEAKLLSVSLNDDKKWTECIKSVDLCLKNRQKLNLQLSLSNDVASFSLEKVQKFEQLLTAIGGEPLCKNVILLNEEKAHKHVMDSIQNASKQNNQNIKYISALKSVDILPKIKDKNIWNKYGSRYKISMDLDYDSLVANDDKFENKILDEFAYVLNINRSLIRIESTVKGSIIVSCSICAVGFVFMMFGMWSVNKLSYLIQQSDHKMKGGESIIGLRVGDDVLVDWKERMYEASIIEKCEHLQGEWVKVRYTGNPFTFQNVEKLDTNSSRLHIKEPGYEYKASLHPDGEGNVSFHVIPIFNHM